MKLYVWRGAERNFGDELNLILWPRLLPGFFDDDDTVRFLGIGSVLDRRHPTTGLKVVAGAGYGGYQAPAVLDDGWRIHWVRGPKTAQQLGLPAGLGLGDPASLVGGVIKPDGRPDKMIGYMPHFESAAAGNWQAAAEAAGFALIDPRGDPRAVLSAIGRCRLLLSEALHGVIVADALRVPWIAVQPRAPVHRAKWDDWAATLDLDIAFHRLPAASLLQLAETSQLARYHAARIGFGRIAAGLRPAAAGWFVDRAALALRRVQASVPQLSADVALRRCQERMLARVDQVKRDPFHVQSFSG